MTTGEPEQRFGIVREAGLFRNCRQFLAGLQSEEVGRRESRGSGGRREQLETVAAPPAGGTPGSSPWSDLGSGLSTSALPFPLNQPNQSTIEQR